MPWYEMSAGNIAQQLGLLGRDGLNAGRGIKYGDATYARSEVEERELGNGLPLHKFWESLFDEWSLSLAGINVLSVGGNSGTEIAHMPGYDQAAHIINSDISHPALTRGSSLAVIKHAQADAIRLPFASNTFDIAFCLRTLSVLDVDERVSAIQGLHRVLKPGGLTIISVPNGYLDQKTGQIVGGQLMNTGEADTSQPFRHLEEINKILQNEGFQPKAQRIEPVELFLLAQKH